MATGVWPINSADSEDLQETLKYFEICHLDAQLGPPFDVRNRPLALEEPRCPGDFGVA
jgi:hypothetical protein